MKRKVHGKQEVKEVGRQGYQGNIGKGNEEGGIMVWGQTGKEERKLADA